MEGVVLFFPVLFFQKSLGSHCCLKLPKSVCLIGCLETLEKLQFAWGVAE